MIAGHSLVPEAEREIWKERLWGVGFHAEKRAGVRDPEIRALPAKIQETIAGTRYTTLRDVLDVREAWEALPRAESAAR